MASLKDYRDRIASVKSTRKITSAMKMVAASKLRKAQETAEHNISYARAMRKMTVRVALSCGSSAISNVLLCGHDIENSKFLLAKERKRRIRGGFNVASTHPGKALKKNSKSHLLVVITASRGLCGGFNGGVIRLVRAKIKELQKQKKLFRIMCIGKKGYDVLRREYANQMVDMYTYKDMGTKDEVTYSGVESIAEQLISGFKAEDFDECSVFYNQFKSVLTQVPKEFRLLPIDIGLEDREALSMADDSCLSEPEEGELLDNLLPINVCVQLYQAILDSAAGEQAARMTAMDNATNAAGDMIDGLTLKYNRERQAVITKELIEIISGAETT